VIDSLRVAFLVDPLTLKVKGGNHAPRLARELLGRGHIVRGFGSPPGTIPRPSDEDLGEHKGRTLVGFEPDVLVAYDALSPTALMGARAARRLGAALVLVEPGLQPARQFQTRLLQHVGEWMWGRYVRNTASAVVALDPIAREHSLADGFGSEMIHVVPTGIDLDEYRPGLTSGLVARTRVRGRILLYVGALMEHRGLSTLISAFGKSIGQQGEWSLLLAGEGSAQARLRALAGQLGIADRVHWLSTPRPEELPGLLGAATLYAVPATGSDVLGRHLGRAMACGVPCLASYLPRFEFLVEHEETGLLVTPGDVAAWSAAIERAAGSPAVRERWGTTGRTFAEERLNWRTVAEEIEGLLVGARERVRERLESRVTDRKRTA
jgi:glycosyltransferase involved in cell wall biosynthesis